MVREIFMLVNAVAVATDACIGNVRSIRIKGSMLVVTTDLDAITVVNTAATGNSLFGVSINGYESKTMSGTGTAG